MVAPVLRARAAVEAVHGERRYQGKGQYEWPEAEVKKQLAGLGGPEKASKALGLYIAAPLKRAKHKEIAFRMLTDCGEPAWPAIRRVLNNRDPKMRSLAAYFLSNNNEAVGNAQAVLLTLLNDPDEGVRHNASNALVSIGGKAIPGLVDQLRTGNAKAQDYTIGILFSINDPDALARQKGVRELLMKHLKKGKDEYGIAATVLLVSIDPLILKVRPSWGGNLRWMDRWHLLEIPNLPAPDFEGPPDFDDFTRTRLPSEQHTIDYVKAYLALPDRPEEMRKAARWVLNKYPDAPRPKVEKATIVK